MPQYNLPTETGINFTQGLDRLFVYVAQEVPAFIPLTLVSLFLIILIAGSLAQRRQEGKVDYPMWFTIAGFITSTSAMMMLLVDDLIMLEVVVITIAITLVAAIVFFMSKER